MEGAHEKFLQEKIKVLESHLQMMEEYQEKSKERNEEIEKISNQRISLLERQLLQKDELMMVQKSQDSLIYSLLQENNVLKEQLDQNGSNSQKELQEKCEEIKSLRNLHQLEKARVEEYHKSKEKMYRQSIQEKHSDLDKLDKQMEENEKELKRIRLETKSRDDAFEQLTKEKAEAIRKVEYLKLELEEVKKESKFNEISIQDKRQLSSLKSETENLKRSNRQLEVSNERKNKTFSAMKSEIEQLKTNNKNFSLWLIKENEIKGNQIIALEKAKSLLSSEAVSLRKELDQREQRNVPSERVLQRANELAAENMGLNAEIDVSMKTKEADFNQISNRFEDLQIECSIFLIPHINRLSQNILNLKAEKEEAKDFLEVLQKQNDELICQNQESSTKLRQTEDIVETGKHRILELEKLHSFSKKSLEEKQKKVRTKKDKEIGNLNSVIDEVARHKKMLDNKSQEFKREWEEKRYSENKERNGKEALRSDAAIALYIPPHKKPQRSDKIWWRKKNTHEVKKTEPEVTVSKIDKETDDESNEGLENDSGIEEEVKPEEKDIIIDKMPARSQQEVSMRMQADTQSDETVQVATPPQKRSAGGRHEDAGCFIAINTPAVKENISHTSGIEPSGPTSQANSPISPTTKAASPVMTSDTQNSAIGTGLLGFLADGFLAFLAFWTFSTAASLKKPDPFLPATAAATSFSASISFLSALRTRTAALAASTLLLATFRSKFIILKNMETHK